MAKRRTQSRSRYRYRHRDADTGLFVNASFAKRHPKTTVRERWLAPQAQPAGKSMR